MPTGTGILAPCHFTCLHKIKCYLAVKSGIARPSVEWCLQNSIGCKYIEDAVVHYQDLPSFRAWTWSCCCILDFKLFTIISWWLIGEPSRLIILNFKGLPVFRHSCWQASMDILMAGDLIFLRIKPQICSTVLLRSYLKIAARLLLIFLIFRYRYRATVQLSRLSVQDSLGHQSLTMIVFFLQLPLL